MQCASCAVEFIETEPYVSGRDGQAYHPDCAALSGQATPKQAMKLVPTPGSTPAVYPPTPMDPAPKPSGPDRPIPMPTPYEQTFPIVLDERRRVLVPLHFDEDDLEYVYGVLGLYVQKRKKVKA